MALATVKKLAESTNLTSIPSHYKLSSIHDQSLNHHPIISSDQEIPTIDFSLLVHGTPEQRIHAVQALGKACTDWGFFMVVNHGVSESLIESMLEVCREFFDLSDDEKRDYVGRNVLDPIRYGTSFNLKVDKVLYWRDYLKVLVHPTFYSPHAPANFSTVANEYCSRIRALVKELLRGISESLGLEGCYLEKASELKNGQQIIIVNYYPPCPQPELAMGMPPHSDHGLLTVLSQNDVGGLHVQHNGNWVVVNPLPNSLLVNTGDQLEILSNGKYKSVLHRAVVNNHSTRMSIATANGPSLDQAVMPAPWLVDGDDGTPKYQKVTYREYVEFQQSNNLDGKSCLDLVKVKNL